MKDREIAEYVNLRTEIVERAKLLHHLITAAVWVSVVFLLFGFWLVNNSTSEQYLWFLSGVPLVFSLLTFNYQSNQMTLEAIARYINSKKQSDDWDDFYGTYKRRVLLTSFLKVLPLLVPQVVIFVLLLSSTLTRPQAATLVVDIIFFVLVVLNFRYKMFR